MVVQFLVEPVKLLRVTFQQRQSPPSPIRLVRRRGNRGPEGLQGNGLGRYAGFLFIRVFTTPADPAKHPEI